MTHSFTPSLLAMPDRSKNKTGIHWFVNLNRRNRTLSFLAVFTTLATHLWFTSADWLTWLLLALSFIVWPQLAYLRASRSRDSMNAEFNNLIGDSAMFGLWISTLGYPLWISSMLATSTCMNLMVFRGYRGFVQAIAGLATGLVCGTLMTGYYLVEQTHWLTSLFGFSTIFGYLMLVGYTAYKRNLVLHAARERQRVTEQELKLQIGENQQLQLQLEDLANRDHLTNLYNRRYLHDSLPRELARCEREGLPLSLILIDIDHFKDINDHYGHTVGDQVIQALAEQLSRTCRGSDIACRFGGEEFLIVLPGMNGKAAEARANSIREAFRLSNIKDAPEGLSLTLSAGVATTTGPCTLEALVQVADKALYGAKTSGRDRVVNAEAPAAASPLSH